MARKNKRNKQRNSARNRYTPSVPLRSGHKNRTIRKGKWWNSPELEHQLGPGSARVMKGYMDDQIRRAHVKRILDIEDLNEEEFWEHFRERYYGSD